MFSSQIPFCLTHATQVVEFCQSALAQCTLLQHPPVVPLAPMALPSQDDVGAAATSIALQPEALASYFQLEERSNYSHPVAMQTSTTPPLSRDMQAQTSTVNAAPMATMSLSADKSSLSSSVNLLPSVSSVQPNCRNEADGTKVDHDTNISTEGETATESCATMPSMETDALQMSKVLSLNDNIEQQQSVIPEGESNTETKGTTPFGLLLDDDRLSSVSKAADSQPAGSSTLQTGLSGSETGLSISQTGLSGSETGLSVSQSGLSVLQTGLSGSGSGAAPEVQFIPLQENDSDSDSDSDSDVDAEIALFVDKPPDRDETFPQQQQEDMEL